MIVLIGPAGETGRRIIEIAGKDGVEFRLCARDPHRAKRRLGPLGEGLTIDTVDARDGAAVEALLQPGDVLLNAATPGGQLGHGLARAAIGAGAHYVAFTGEVVDAFRMLRELDAPARERGVTLCPGAGSSGGVGDVALRLALHRLPQARSGYIGSAITGFTASHGTMLSEMHILNGPGVIVRSGELVLEDTVGKIFRRDGMGFVGRPLIDPLMAWTYAGLDDLDAGIEIPEESLTAVADLFRETAEMLRSDTRRAAYAEKIAPSADDRIPEDSASPEGTRTAIVWDGLQTVKVVLSSRPVYEVTARAALLVARELAEGKGGPAGFQALTSIVRSTDHALQALGSRILEG